MIAKRMSDVSQTKALVAEVRTIRRLLFCLLLMAVGVMLFFGKDIFLPIVLGILITLTLSPVVRFLHRLFIPYALGALLAIVTIGIIISMSVSSMSTPLTELFEDIPRLGQRLEEHFAPFKETVDQISKAGDELEKAASGGGESGVSEVTLGGPGVLTTAASTFAAGMTSLFIALVLALFMLGSGNLFYEKIISVVPQLSDKKRAVIIVHAVESRVSRYLFTITFINAVLGLVISTGLSLYGAPNPLLWGAIAFVLNFLPFAGAIIGAALLAILSFGHYDSLTAALVPPLIYYGSSALEGNLITPYIVGRSMKLNIVAVFVSVVFWGWLWGLMGALMAIPILLVLTVLSENIERWSTFRIFLTDRSSVMAESNESRLEVFVAKALAIQPTNNAAA